jgi:hypothetical protein
MFNPEHDVLFLLDHSCGHDWQREDGLNVENMNKSFGSNKTTAFARQSTKRAYLVISIVD